MMHSLKAVNIDPLCVKAYGNLCHVYWKMGRQELAQKYFLLTINTGSAI